MPRPLVGRSRRHVEEIQANGDLLDSRKTAWRAIRAGSKVIRDIQQVAQSHKRWRSLQDAYPVVNAVAKKILDLRLRAIQRHKVAPHHEEGFRLSSRTGVRHPRAVKALCLISGHEGQEIPGLVRYDRVVVDAEHMEQALGPATIAEIFRIRKSVGEHVYVSTNVSETPQIVRNLKTGEVDSRASASLTASKVISALQAGVDVVKVGFANLDPSKRDLRGEEVVRQMKLVRELVDEVVAERAMVLPLTLTGQFPLVSVFFPEIGIDSHGERPREIAEKAIRLTAEGGWQGILLDTFEKHTGRRYRDFYTLADTAELSKTAHKSKLEFWIAGSIAQEEVAELIRCQVDLICFGGAARLRSGRRPNFDRVGGGAIQRDLVEGLVAEFERSDPR